MSGSLVGVGAAGASRCAVAGVGALWGASHAEVRVFSGTLLYVCQSLSGRYLSLFLSKMLYVGIYMHSQKLTMGIFSNFKS